MSFYKEVPGRKTTLESALKFDTEPKAGSTNPVTSDGVKSAIDGAVGDAAAALQEQIDEIAEKAGSGYIPNGEATVATLNALSGQENGDLYTMTNAGTLTEGSLAVVAGDTVAWDATNEVWYKAMDYAPRQYGTNEAHNLPTTITAFRTGDVIPVDGPSGTAKMPAEILKKNRDSILFSTGFLYVNATGNNTDYIDTDLSFFYGEDRGVEIIFPDGIWDTSGIGTYAALYLTAFDEDNVKIEDVVKVKEYTGISAGYTIKTELPANTRYVKLRLRGTKGEEMNVKLGKYDYILSSELGVSTGYYTDGIEGDNDNYVRKLYRVPNTKGTYSIQFADGLWDVSSVTSINVCNVAQYDETMTQIGSTIVELTRTDITTNPIYFEVAENCSFIRVSIRATLGKIANYRIGARINERLVECENLIRPIVSSGNGSKKTFSVVGDGDNAQSVFIPVRSSGFFKFEFSPYPYDITGVTRGALFIETYDSNDVRIDDCPRYTLPQPSFDSPFTSGSILYVSEKASYIKVQVRAKVGEEVSISVTDVSNEFLKNNTFGLFAGNKFGNQEVVGYEGEKIVLPKKYFFNYKKLFTPPVSPITSYSNPQAMLVFEDKFIIFDTYAYGHPAACRIVNSDGTIYSTFEFSGEAETCHCNCASFGLKYQNTDKVPLIYLSSNTNKKCYVIRVADDFSGYTLVQTIDYGGSKLSDYNWCDYVVDLNCNYLYVYQKFGASADKIFKCKVLKFLLPSISNQLTLQDTDERGEYLINGAYVNQAVQIYGNKMYAICGLNGVDSPYELDVADIGTGNVVTRLPLDWLGEPEGISFDAQGNMFISRNDIYKIEF